MDEFELEDNLEFILQSIQELIEDQGDNNPFGEVNQNELLANLVNYDQVRLAAPPGSHFSCLMILFADVVRVGGPNFFSLSFPG